jgi:ribosome assembly protein 1
LSPEFKEKLLEELKLSGEVWAKEIDNIWAFGPRRVGPNILLNHIPDYASSPYQSIQVPSLPKLLLT